MRRLRYLALVCLLASHVTHCLASEHEFKIELKAATVSFGEPIMVNLIHRNRSNAVWTLEQPDRLTGCSVVYQLLSKQPSPLHSMHFGERRVHVVKGVDGSAADVYWDVRAPKIKIEPNEEFVFTTNLFSKSGVYHLSPGHWRVAARNASEKLEAEPREIDIVFTIETVDYLVQGASPPNDGGMREWSRQWLKKLQPDLPVEERRAPPQSTPEEAAAIKEKNRKDVEEFTNWWTMNRDTPEVQKLIDAINRDYGLHPERVRREIEAFKPKSSD